MAVLAGLDAALQGKSNLMLLSGSWIYTMVLLAPTAKVQRNAGIDGECPGGICPLLSCCCFCLSTLHSSQSTVVSSCTDGAFGSPCATGSDCSSSFCVSGSCNDGALGFYAQLAAIVAQQFVNQVSVLILAPHVHLAATVAHQSVS
ncbi:predicted protein [Chaetoceros tenuissimus]|uniref:Uncharacterized protein n=1 Tax=Chaetoceros tenuissimus TaxID=426638 RepID=A0AAD3CDV2_9STRA|nr:predicted protein [Chaetoceros tenuissimus]